MPTVNDFIRQKLASNTPAENRVYAGTIGQRSQMPAIVFEEAGGGSLTHAGGAGGVAQTTVVVNAIGKNFDDALEVAESVRRTLDGFSGEFAGITIQHCLMVPGSRRQNPYVVGDAEDQLRFGVSQDFSIMHTESAPNT